MNRALLLVDLQNDFLPGGALPVDRGDEVIPVANQLLPRFSIVAATRDWHPANHASFAVNHPGQKVGDTILLAGKPQILWPVHCVQGTWGAEFPASLAQDHLGAVVSKGTDPELDSYSGFFDNEQRRATGLDDYLHREKVGELWIMGLATDYCVRATVLDALRLGYPTRVVRDGCRAVNLQPGDEERAWQAMQQAGAQLVASTAAWD